MENFGEKYENTQILTSDFSNNFIVNNRFCVKSAYYLVIIRKN